MANYRSRLQILPLGYAFTIALLASSAAKASTFEPANINLGVSSFMDGFASTEPGAMAYIPALQYSDYNRISDDTGHTNPLFKNPRVGAFVLSNQFAYNTPFHLFGGILGLTTVIPIVDLNASDDHESLVDFTANRGVALADITWGPYLQMPPIVVGGRPVFVQRFEFDVVSPAGQINRSNQINPGSGFWSINPEWAMTALPTPKTEISTRINYLYNFTNDNPAGTPPSLKSYRAGASIWVNFTASYKILPNLNLGLNGYYFKQIADDLENGATVRGTSTVNLSMGPGAMYTLNRSNFIFANIYLPVVAKNTASGPRAIIRLIHVF